MLTVHVWLHRDHTPVSGAWATPPHVSSTVGPMVRHVVRTGVRAKGIGELLYRGHLSSLAKQPRPRVHQY